jgi:hypothetical protein
MRNSENMCSDVVTACGAIYNYVKITTNVKALLHGNSLEGEEGRNMWQRRAGKYQCVYAGSGRWA